MSDIIKQPPVLPPPTIPAQGRDPGQDAPPPGSGTGVRLHPLSGILIILIDNMCWGIETLTAYLATPVLMVLSFMVTSIGVFLVQKFLHGDKFGPSAAKAFVSGVLAGVPFSIAGTIWGTTVLFMAGLSSFGSKHKLR